MISMVKTERLEIPGKCDPHLDNEIETNKFSHFQVVNQFRQY